jgi:hypothetical protein
MWATSLAASEQHIYLYWSVPSNGHGFATHHQHYTPCNGHHHKTCFLSRAARRTKGQAHRQDQLSSVLSVLDMPVTPPTGAWCRHTLVHGEHQHAYVFPVKPQ